MAHAERENILGFTDKRRKQTDVANVVGNLANYGSVNALRLRLAAANATYFNSGRLDQMTKNDMVFALRTIDDAAGQNFGNT